MADDDTVEAQVNRHYRFNVLVNVLDGGSFWFGYSFMAPAIILPLYVSHFTDSNFLIGLVAVINGTGYFLPQLFTSRWVERLPIKKDVPVKIGFFSERLPIILLAPSALLLAGSPTLALLAFFILFAWHAYGAGIVAVAWNDMIAKVIPVRRRGMFFGVTNALGAGTGVAGAAAVAYLLDRLPFPNGYGVAFGIAAVFIVISWIFLAQTREPRVEPVRKAVSQRQYWHNLGLVLRADRNFRVFIVASALLTLGGMAWGFLAVYMARRWDLSDGGVSSFVPAMLVGQALGNLLLGWVGDRHGYKRVLEIGGLALALSILIVILAPQPVFFSAVFALRGVGMAGLFMATMIAMEFSAADIRPTYIGVNNTATGVFSLVSPLIGSWLATLINFQVLFIVSLVLNVLGLVVLHWMVREPRHLAREAQTVRVDAV